jgi:hypothetical protein
MAFLKAEVATYFCGISMEIKEKVEYVFATYAEQMKKILLEDEEGTNQNGP